MLNALLVGWLAGELHIRPDGKLPVVREPVTSACDEDSACLERAASSGTAPNEEPLALPAFQCVFRWKAVSIIRDPVARLLS